MMKVTALTKEFQQGKGRTPFLAVDHVSFEVATGSIMALLGPNGAGKTTIVQLLGGYLLPTSGMISLNGIDISKTMHQKARQEIGIVFGGELGFYHRASAKDNLMFFANLAALPRKDQKKEVQRVLELVNLAHVQTQTVQSFSRGMYQRLHLARALLGNPQLLLLDEPTNGLDVEMAWEMRELIKKLAQDGVTILLTTHLMNEIEFLADRILLLGGGKLFHDGTTESIMQLSRTVSNSVETLEEAYLLLAEQLRRDVG